MKETILEQFQNVQRKENVNAEQMSEATNIMLEAINPNLESIQKIDREYEYEKISTIYLKDKNHPDEEHGGFVELKDNHIELQYYGDTEEDLAVVVIESDKDQVTFSASIDYTKENERISLNVIQDKIIINDKVLPIPEHSSLVEIANLVSKVIKDYQFFKEKEDNSVKTM